MVEITSQSHPDSSVWYENQSVFININAPLWWALKYHYEFNEFLTVPEIGSSQFTYNNTWIIPSLQWYLLSSFNS